MKIFLSFSLLALVAGFSSCKETDEVTDYATGKTPIEQGKKATDALNKIQQQTTQEQQKALDAIK